MENPNPLISRRQFAVVGALAASAAVAASRAHAAVGLLPTPGQILGPFWPTQAVPDMSGDLIHVPGRTGRAVGQVLHVTGRVLNRDGTPVANAKLDIWQANAAGRYRHPSDTNPAPLDPNFDGFAELTTNPDGSYRFTTIKPGSYPAGPNIMRPGAHSLRRHRTYNASDRWLQSALRPEALIVTPKPPTSDFEPDSRMVTFDIVLIDG